MNSGFSSEAHRVMPTNQSVPTTALALRALLGMLGAVIVASMILCAVLTAWALRQQHGRAEADHRLGQLQDQLAQLQLDHSRLTDQAALHEETAKKLQTTQTELEQAHEQVKRLMRLLEQTEAEKKQLEDRTARLQEDLDQANARVARLTKELLLAKSAQLKPSVDDPLEHAALLAVKQPAEALKLLRDPRVFPMAKRDFAWQWLQGRAEQRRVETKSIRLTKLESLGVDRDGALFVALDGDKSLAAYDWAEGVLALHEKLLPQTTVVMHPSGKHFYTAGTDRLIHVWDVASGKRKFTSRALHQATISGMGLTRDGKWLVTGDLDGVIRGWDASTCLDKFSFRGPVGRVRVVLMTDDAKMVISSAADKTIRLWDVPGKRPLFTLPGHSAPIQAMTLSGDSAYLASTDAVNSMRIWDLKQQEECGMLDKVSVSALTFSPDNKQVIAATTTGQLLVWDIAKRKKIIDWPLTPPGVGVAALAFNESGTLLTTVTFTGTITRWDVTRDSE